MVDVRDDRDVANAHFFSRKYLRHARQGGHRFSVAGLIQVFLRSRKGAGSQGRTAQSVALMQWPPD
ncbi:hypothetical protein EKH55_3132 [Sinorhizobium alkalisoli]|nr:hypothetical protein EKH55_3132 [Sinorhizobium alkalisoli]